MGEHATPCLALRRAHELDSLRDQVGIDRVDILDRDRATNEPADECTVIGVSVFIDHFDDQIRAKIEADGGLAVFPFQLEAKRVAIEPTGDL